MSSVRMCSPGWCWMCGLWLGAAQRRLTGGPLGVDGAAARAGVAGAGVAGAGKGTHPEATGVQPAATAERMEDLTASSVTQAAESYLLGIPEFAFQWPTSSSWASGTCSWRPMVG